VAVREEVIEVPEERAKCVAGAKGGIWDGGSTVHTNLIKEVACETCKRVLDRKIRGDDWQEPVLDGRHEDVLDCRVEKRLSAREDHA